MFKSSITLALTAAALLAAGAGCGSNTGTVKVQGTVTLDGEPLEGASVTFQPDGKEGRPASGVTDKNGTFQLGTFSTNDGALPGGYKVIITKSSTPTVPGMPAADDSEAMKKFMEGGGYRKAMEAVAKQPASARKSFVPGKYADPTKTPFKQTVPPSGKVTFELSSK
jgi:hypothetical protein